MKMRFQNVLGVAGLAMAMASSAFGQGVIYANDFENDSVGTYTVANLNADWNSPSGENGIAQGRGSIVDGADAFDAGRSFRALYPEGQVGSSDNDGGGVQWKLDLGQSYDELYLSYRLRFGAGFDFVRGGKLPGLAGGTANSGGNKPDGTDGWSGRMMWRTDGSGGSATTRDTANAVQYLYHPDQPTQFGEDLRWDDGAGGAWAEFESDTWYQFQHRVVMNTPGQHDGVVQAWLDGELVLDASGIRFRDDASFAIDQVYFSTFFGGSGPEWAPTKDEHIFFDDFVVSTEAIVAVPEPSALLIGLAGSGALAFRRRRR